MMITFSEEESNRQFVNFSEMEKAVHETAMKIGSKMIGKLLEYQDEIILKNRDKARYRCKGLRKTSIMTRVGIVEYRRRVYVDMQAKQGEKRCVFLLDEALAMEKIGRISEEVCTEIAERVCESSFRNSAEILSEEMAASISHETVWNVTQKMGERKLEEADQKQRWQNRRKEQVLWKQKFCMKKQTASG